MHNEEESDGLISSWKLKPPQYHDTFVGTLLTLNGIDEVSPCDQVVISDHAHEIQHQHIDRVSTTWPQFVGRSAKLFIGLKTFDTSRPDGRPVNDGDGKPFVPTRSIIVHFKDQDGVVFPEATNLVRSTKHLYIGSDGVGARIDGKRGHIIMFDNYADGRLVDSPNANPKASHYGLYDLHAAKRIFVGGIVSKINIGGPRS